MASDAVSSRPLGFAAMRPAACFADSAPDIVVAGITARGRLDGAVVARGGKRDAAEIINGDRGQRALRSAGQEHDGGTRAAAIRTELRDEMSVKKLDVGVARVFGIGGRGLLLPPVGHNTGGLRKHLGLAARRPMWPRLRGTCPRAAVVARFVRLINFVFNFLG